MISRCTNPTSPHFGWYGGRGIKVCERWLTFENFLADMGERPAGMTLDRIDNNGDYEPGNCRWATRKEQAANTRNNRVIEYQRERRILADWSRIFGVDCRKIWKRLKVGCSPEQAFSKARLNRRAGREMVS